MNAPISYRFSPQWASTNLADEAVEVGVGRSVHVQTATANVVNGLIVHHESAIGMLQSGVGGQDRVVGLNHGGGDLGRRVDSEF